MFDEAHALRIVYHGTETHRIEYKRSVSWVGKARYKLIRIIAGLANCGGGYLVVGYDEEKEGDNRFVGIDDTHLQSWDVTNVARDVNNYIQPSIDIEVRFPQSRDQSTTFVVVRVPSHGSLPHICMKDAGDDRHNTLRRGALYCRNRNKEDMEISSLDDWRDLVQRLTLAKKSEIQELIVGAISSLDSKGLQIAVSAIDLDVEIQPIEDHALGLQTAETTDLPLLIIAAVPIGDSLTQDIDQSKLALKSASVDYRGWPFIFYLEQGEYCHPQFDEDAIWAVDTQPFNGLPTFYYWQFKYTRSLFYSAQITPEASMGLGSNIDAYDHSRLMSEALIAIGRLYESLEFPVNTPVDILLRYMKLSGAEIGVMQRSQLPHPYKGSQITLRKTIDLNELLTRPWNRAAELISEIGQQMGVRRQLPLDYMVGLAKKHLSTGQRLYEL